MNQHRFKITTGAMWTLLLSQCAFPPRPFYIPQASATQQSVSHTRITHGVASGDVTDSSAVIWARADSEAILVIEYTTTAAFGDPRLGGQVHVTGETDFTGTVTLTGLHPATRYYYR